MSGMASGAEHPDWRRDGADWPNRAASRFLRAGPVTWHVQRMGPPGETLLLLHGAGAATHSWRALMPLLARRWDVIAPDLPGHGFTRAPAGAFAGLPAMVHHVAALVDALGVRPRLLVGHSAGAAIAIGLALDGAINPAAIVGLNAALTPFRGAGGTVFPMLAKLLALNPLTPPVFAAFARWTGQTRRLIEGTGSTIDDAGLALYARMIGRPDHVSGALSMMAGWDVRPLLAALPTLNVPLHLVVGTADRTVAPGEAVRLAARHAGIVLHRMEDLGHLMHEERPEEAAALIERIASDPARSATDTRGGATLPRPDP